MHWEMQAWSKASKACGRYLEALEAAFSLDDQSWSPASVQLSSEYVFNARPCAKFDIPLAFTG